MRRTREGFGTRSVIVRYDRSVRVVVRTAETNEQLLGVSCCEGEAFAVGMRGTIRRWDGNSWSVEESGTTEDLYAIHRAKDAAGERKNQSPSSTLVAVG